MRDFAERFYKSKRWQAVRKAYADQAGGLCERCAGMGKITPGEIVHHRVELTPDNIRNPDIALSFANLELVCRDCHGLRHRQGGPRRYSVDSEGKVTALTSPLVEIGGKGPETGQRVRFSSRTQEGGCRDG